PSAVDAGWNEAHRGWSTGSAGRHPWSCRIVCPGLPVGWGRLHCYGGSLVRLEVSSAFEYLGSWCAGITVHSGLGGGMVFHTVHAAAASVPGDGGDLESK